MTNPYEEMIKMGMNEKEIEEYFETVKKSRRKSDSRYNTPKEEPKVSEKDIDNTIKETEIYRKAKLAILRAQQRQVGYGMEKYPEPLNANTWSVMETIDHIIEESIDKLHYLVMLRIKLEQDLVTNDADNVNTTYIAADKIAPPNKIHISGTGLDSDYFSTLSYGINAIDLEKLYDIKEAKDDE